jgi:hypothetical protein
LSEGRTAGFLKKSPVENRITTKNKKTLIRRTVISKIETVILPEDVGSKPSSGIYQMLINLRWAFACCRVFR